VSQPETQVNFCKHIRPLFLSSPSTIIFIANYRTMKKIIASILILAVASTSFAQTSKQNAKVESKEVKKEPLPALVAAPTQNTTETKTDSTPPNPNAAKMSFKEETYNFSEIPEGPQVTHEFKFSNTGKEPLILSNVRASCGCTTPSWPKEPVLPGKDAVILVTYNTQGRPGSFNKTITITSNANEPNKIISIKGEVVKAEPEKSVPLEQPSLLSPKN